MSNFEPYYSQVNEYPITNTEKGRLGEEAFKEALLDFPVLMNVTYGERQKDIDHLVFTSKSVIMNECKNNNENFFMYYSWFEDRVFNRFVEGLPIAQFYARTLGYPVRHFTFTLTIPRLNTEPRVKLRLKQIKIHVIETKRQILKAENKKQWYTTVRRQILSVINNQTQNRGDPRHNIENNTEKKETTSSDAPSVQECSSSSNVNCNSSNNRKSSDGNETESRQTSDKCSEIPSEIEEELEQLSKDSRCPIQKLRRRYRMFYRWIQKNQGIPNPCNLAYKRTFLRTKEELMNRKKPKKRIHWKKLQRYRKYCKFAEQKPEHLCLFCMSFEVCSLQELLVFSEHHSRKAKVIQKMNDNKETRDLLTKVQIQLLKVRSKIVLCLKNKLYQSFCLGLPTIKYRTTSEPRKKLSIQNDPSPFPTIKDLEKGLLISDDTIASSFELMKFRRKRYSKEDYYDYA